jgi:isoleucyl-tRNA synthetase
LLKILADEINVKAVEVVPELKEEQGYLFEDGGVFKVALSTSLTPALKEEGAVREITRQIQEMRKLVGLKISDEIALQVAADEETCRLLINNEDYLKERTVTKNLEFANQLVGVFDIEKEIDFEVPSGQRVKIKIGLRKL